MVDNLVSIFDENGKRYDMSSLGLTGLKLNIPSPSYRVITKEIDGQSGSMVMDRTLNSRELTASFYTESDDYIDSLVLRDRLYRILGIGKPLYVSESKLSGRRWQVYLQEWTPDRLDIKHHKFDIPLIAYTGTSESVYVAKEVFSATSFRFKNQGDLTIDPRVHSDTKIEVKGTMINPVIRNLTTGDEWSWAGSAVSSDTIQLMGVRSLRNGSSVFGQTNKKLITLDPGWNNFELSGAQGSFTLAINTRFHYL